MKQQYSLEQQSTFFEDYENKNPLIILFYIIISFGIYLLIWIYYLNLRLERIDEDAPEPKRYITILVILPITWGLIITSLSLIFEGSTIFLYGNILGWAIITYLSLQYFFDFCTSYSKITNTNPTVWYLLIYPGYFSIVLSAFNFYNTLSLILFPIITIPIMQFFLNKADENYRLKNTSQYISSCRRK